jgi:uridine phosphorylase
MPIKNPQHAYTEYLADLPEGERFSQHHIKIRQSDLSRYVFIPGSHLRGRRIAERMDDCAVVSVTRGYWLYSGYWKGVFMTVCSTGMGGPVVGIAMEELAKMGADTFIRVGSAGTVQEHLGVGDIVVATATVRFGGTSKNYLPEIYPAAAHFDVTRALIDAGNALGAPIYYGVYSAGDAFYAPKSEETRDLMKKAGVMAMEMESDTQFIMGQYHGWRCGSACVLDGGPKKKIATSSAPGMSIANHADNPEFMKGEDDLITMCLDAMAAIAAKDGGR